MINFHQTVFLKSCPTGKTLPEDSIGEVAFSGRSNVGKSSVLNSLTGQKKLAKSSGVPGKTREINLFRVNENCRLVDLPGYGFARVSKGEQEKWGREMTRYIAERPNLKGVIIIMDIRHPLTALDRDMVDLVRNTGKAFAFLLNKSDKLGNNDLVKTIRSVERELKQMNLPALVIPYSAEKKSGVGELAKLISGWMGD